MKIGNNIEITNEDCMDLMKRYPDNYFDLAVVDPPYGIDAANDQRQGMKFKTAAAKRKEYGYKNWDVNIPTEEYFNALARVSKRQIIWGVNYFKGLQGGRLIWNKNVPPDYTKSKCEIAYKSWGVSCDYVKITWNGMLQQNMKDKQKRIHPTEKPCSLYQWIFKNYAKEGNKILDTHMGSGSIAIALDSVNKIEKMNLTLTACEIDEDYYNAAIKRIKRKNLMAEHILK